MWYDLLYINVVPAEKHFLQLLTVQTVPPPIHRYPHQITDITVCQLTVWCSIIISVSGVAHHKVWLWKVSTGDWRDAVLSIRVGQMRRMCSRIGMWFLYKCNIEDGGTRWHSWLGHCTTNRKVVGSIPDGVFGILHWHNPSGHTMALGLTEPLTEMSTRDISWRIKAACACNWQLYHHHLPNVLKSGNLNCLVPSGPVQANAGIAVQT